MSKRMDRFESPEEPAPKREDDREFDIEDSRRHRNSETTKDFLQRILLLRQPISPEDVLRGAMIETLAFLDIGAVGAAQETLKKALGL